MVVFVVVLVLVLVVFVVLTLITFIGAITSAFFGGAGLFYGQGVYEVDVLEDKYKFECLSNCDDDDLAVLNLSDELESFTNYQTFRDDINGNITSYINGYSIVFTLLTLVFLFLALQEIGVFSKRKDGKMDEY